LQAGNTKTTNYIVKGRKGKAEDIGVSVQNVGLLLGVAWKEGIGAGKRRCEPGHDDGNFRWADDWELQRTPAQGEMQPTRGAVAALGIIAGVAKPRLDGSRLWQQREPVRASAL
jgi:hypothetical protein